MQLFEGQTFPSYTAFKQVHVYETWCFENNHLMKVDSSHKNDIESTLFPYRQIRFSCKHAGKPRIRGEDQAFLACECPVVVRLRYDAKSQNYCLKKTVT